MKRQTRVCVIITCVIRVLTNLTLFASCSFIDKVKDKVNDYLSTKCEHDWQDATCTVPKTCTKCGTTRGEAWGHDFIAGKCYRCGALEDGSDGGDSSSLGGEDSSSILPDSSYYQDSSSGGIADSSSGDPTCEHDWQDATCTAPQICTKCGATVGVSNGHTASDWVVDKAATCKEAGSKHKECTLCGDTIETQTIEKLSHTSSDWVVDKAATCKEAGSKHKECTVCGDTIETQTIEKLSHVPSSDWIIDKAATCKEAGSKHKECTLCGDTIETQTIAKVAHVPSSDWIIDKAATCKEAGSKHKECTVCGDTIETQTIAKVAHVPSSDWVVDKTATCKEAGSKHKECTVCFTVLETQTIAKVAHVPSSDWIVDKAATCKSTGSKHKECTVCFTVLETQTIAKVAHVPSSDWVVDKAVTCTEQGSKHKECTVCKAVVETATISAKGHNYIQSEYVAATCETDGYIIYTCANNCGATKRQTLVSSGHNFNANNACIKCGYKPVNHTHSYTTTTIEAGCLTIGYTQYTCSCGYSYKADYMPERGHRFNDGIVTKQATCTVNGEIKYSCERCSASYTAVLLAAHDYTQTVITAATCTTDGLIEQTCKNCQEKQTQVVKAAHSFNQGSVLTNATCLRGEVKQVTCTVCGHSEQTTGDALGHNFKNGKCTRCDATIPDIVTPDTTQLLYGMYFKIDDIISNYGPDYINEYGVMLDYNSGATIKKVAVYLTQEGQMWRRAIACVGEGITYATYVPYLSYDNQIKYTGLNSDWINTFSLSLNASGVWCYSDYATIGVNLEDNKGNLLLSLYDIGQAGALTRIFTDLNEMKAWLQQDLVCNHVSSDWIIDKAATCKEAGSKHKECTVCGDTIETQTIEKVAHVPSSDWVVDKAATCKEAGSKHKECTVCGDTIETQTIAKVAHVPSSDWVVDKAATCKEVGSKHKECTLCGDTIETQTIAKLSHTASDWVVDKAATCKEAGSKHKECTVCGDTIETQTIAKLLDHVYQNGECKYCGQKQQSSTVTATEGLRYELNRDGLSYSCTGLGTATVTDIVIADTYNGKPVTSIGDSAFESCRGLTSVVIPDSVTSIGSYAFLGCSGLTSVVIPNSVTSIGDWVFMGCDKLVEVINYSSLNITKGSEDYGYVGYNALNVKTSGATDIVNKNGYLFYTYNNDNFLLGYIGTDTNLVLPDSYNGQSYQIYKYAFFNCFGLTSVVIPDSVTSIGGGAFEYCSGLTSVVIPNSVTSIGDRAFYDCDGLTSVVIPDSVTSIGGGAFEYCSGLTKVYYNGTANDWNDISIGSDNSYLTRATRYYYSKTQPTNSGKYWHYDSNGNVVEW